MPVPDDVAALLGVVQYEVDSEVTVERGAVLTSCASTENANPLFWDAATAAELTGRAVAPPSTMSVWMRPHRWAPGRTGTVEPLQAHYDLKDRFGYSEAVVADVTIVFHDVIHEGDRLRTRQVVRSIGEPKVTSLGEGRFWVVDLEYLRGDDDLVGTETYTMFAYGSVR